MNAPIVRLFGVVVVLFALLIVWTSRWTVFDAKSLQQQRAQRAHADRRAEDQARPDPGRRRHRAGAVGAGGRRHLDADLSDRLAVRPGGRLLDRRAQARRPGLELSRGDELRGLQTGLSSIFGQLTLAPGRRRRLHDARPEGPAGRAPAARPGAAGLGRRARPADRRGQGDVRATRATTTTTRTPPGPTSRRSTARPRPAIRRARRSRS